MKNSLRQLGICSTCNHMEECTSRKSWRGPVTFCEEFDDFLISAMAAPPRHSERGIQDADEQRPDDFKGLCVNCEVRESCNLPRPKGGVWHCEEYQ